MCEDAASVDVADEDHRCIGHPGNRHVDQFPIIEIDLSRTSRALDHHDVMLRPQACKAAADDSNQLVPSGSVFTEPHPSPDTTLDNHLGTEVGFGLEQNRVHVGVWRNTRSHRLDHLCPAHLAPVCIDVGIERHVLGLEWRDPESVVVEDPAKRADQKRLSDVGRGALDHQGPRHGGPRTPVGR